MQPNTKFFYKCFLELDASNMTTILSFDSGSIGHLLSSDNEQYFDEKFPIIYKTKIQKKNNKKAYYFNSAIDYALKNNQIFALDLILKYIVKYQNNFVSSYLFKHNMPKLIEKGVKLHDLF